MNFQQLLAALTSNNSNPAQGGGFAPPQGGPDLQSMLRGMKPPTPPAMPPPLPQMGMPPVDGPPPDPGMPTSANMHSNAASATAGLPFTPPRPPMTPDPASVAALSGEAPGTPDFVQEDVKNGRPFPDFPPAGAPPPPPMGAAGAPNLGGGAPPLPQMSSPGSPMMGPDPTAGLQGPDSMAPPPEGEPEPLDASPTASIMGGLADGQAPQMSVGGPSSPLGGGGDLVSLIKRLLHKR